MKMGGSEGSREEDDRDERKEGIRVADSRLLASGATLTSLTDKHLRFA